jgi:hypothetical protein
VRRFVVIATLRGAMESPFAPLDDEGQIAALKAEGMDRQVDSRVVWNAVKDRVEGPASRAESPMPPVSCREYDALRVAPEPIGRVDKMLALAGARR